jgi:formylglycine-generating enzyme required for sulfatase activity
MLESPFDMFRHLSVVFVGLLCVVAFTLPGLGASALTVAGSGDAIPYPTSTNTYAVTNGGKAVQVPSGMVYVPAGSFTFGSGATASNVTLEAFCIGKFPVTEAEYKAFADSTGLRDLPRHWRNGAYPEGRANHPVPNVSLNEALRYCEWVSSRTGWKVTIPSAAQWEKAARGPKGFLYPWGNWADVSYRGGELKTRFNFNAVTAVQYLTTKSNVTATYNNRRSPFFGMVTNAGRIAAYDSRSNAIFLAVSPEGGVRGWVNHETWTGFIYTDVFSALNERGGNTSPVGAYPEGVSGYGCHDMAGNLWNWTTTMITARTGAEAGKQVNEIRGGSWYATGNSCRSTGIGEGRAAWEAYNTVGFRVVMIP